MVYYATMSESQRVMCWKIILKEFGTNIQHISGFYKMIADNLIRMLPVPNYQGINTNRRDQFHVSKLFETSA